MIQLWLEPQVNGAYYLLAGSTRVTAIGLRATTISQAISNFYQKPRYRFDQRNFLHRTLLLEMPSIDDITEANYPELFI